MRQSLALNARRKSVCPHWRTREIQRPFVPSDLPIAPIHASDSCVTPTSTAPSLPDTRTRPSGMSFELFLRGTTPTYRNCPLGFLTRAGRRVLFSAGARAAGALLFFAVADGGAAGLGEAS